MNRVTLEAEGLTVDFGGMRAVDGFGIAVRPGTVTGLVGPNGAGKSSVLNLINGYYPADQGQIRLSGGDRDQEITTLPIHMRARLGIGRTFQAPRLIPEVTASENVALGEAWRGSFGVWRELLPLPGTRRRRAARDREVREILRRFGLEGRDDVPAGLLSLGEQRIVELARAVFARTSVLLLDEPFAGVSRSERKPLGQELLRLAESGVAVLLVEHNLDMVRWLASETVVMDRGKVLVVGSPDETFSDPRVEELYLGVKHERGVVEE